MKSYTIISDEEINDMEMPVPCAVCGSWFDLNDGYTSEVLNNTVICEKCFREEEEHIERQEEIRELLDTKSDAEWTVRDCTQRLIALGHKFEQDEK